MYSSSGKFLESEDIPKKMDAAPFSKPLLADYYDARIQFYEHYATNSYDASYIQLIKEYRDSLLRLLDPTTVQYKITLAQKLIYQQSFPAAQKELRVLMDSIQLQDADYAMATYLLAVTYRQQHQLDTAQRYYMLSALADVKNAIKDNASLQNLAVMFYKNGDIDQAYLYTHKQLLRMPF